MASKARIWTHEIVLILPTNTRRISTRVVLTVRTEVAGDRCPLCVYLLYILCALRDPRAALKNAPHTSVTSAGTHFLSATSPLRLLLRTFTWDMNFPLSLSPCLVRTLPFSLALSTAQTKNPLR